MAGNSNASEQVTYAAAQLKEHVKDLDDDSEAHPHAGLIEDDDTRELLNYLATVYDGDITESELYRDILRNESTDTLTGAVGEGNVSQMQYAVGLVSNENSVQDSNTRAWMRNAILDEAYIGMVTGGPGSGKTAFALDRADEWHMATRGRVATNIHSATEKNEVPEYIDDFEGVEEFFKSAKTDVLFIFDETDQELSGKGENRQKGEAIAKLLKLIRKGDAPAGTNRAILLVGQTIKGATKELRRLVATNGHLWRKVAKTRVEVYDDPTTGELSNKTPTKTITGLRDARWDYSTGEDSSFDMSGAFDSDDGEGALTERQKDIKTAIRAVAIQDMTYREAASLTDYAKDWVGERYKEWRDEHQYVEFVNLEPEEIGADE